MLGMDGLAAEKEGVGRGVDGLGSVLGCSMPLGSWDAVGGDPFGGRAMGCSGFNGRSGRSGNEMSSPLEGYQSSA
jgi:hypothetical protein